MIVQYAYYLGLWIIPKELLECSEPKVRTRTRWPRKSFSQQIIAETLSTLASNQTDCLCNVRVAENCFLNSSKGHLCCKQLLIANF